MLGWWELSISGCNPQSNSHSDLSQSRRLLAWNSRQEKKRTETIIAFCPDGKTKEAMHLWQICFTLKLQPNTCLTLHALQGNTEQFHLLKNSLNASCILSRDVLCHQTVEITDSELWSVFDQVQQDTVHTCRSMTCSRDFFFLFVKPIEYVLGNVDIIPVDQRYYGLSKLACKRMGKNMILCTLCHWLWGLDKCNDLAVNVGCNYGNLTYCSTCWAVLSQGQ